MVCCCKNRPFFAAVLVLGLLGIAFHLVGFVAPGWIVMMRTISITEITVEKTEAMMMMQDMNERGQLIDNGGVRPPPDAEDDKMDAKKPERVPESRKREEPKREQEPLMVSEKPPHIQESAILVEWVRQIMLKTEVKNVRLSYGMWFSTICVGEPHGEKKPDRMDLKSEHKGKEGDMQDDKEGDSDMQDDEEGDMRDDKEGKKDGKGHHHDCKKISTHCAMGFSYLFEDFKAPKQVLSSHNIAHASLKEHHIELSAAIALMVVGLIAGLVAFRKHEGPKAAAIICILCFLVSAILIAFPVMRFAHYSHGRRHNEEGVKVHCPYSVYASGIGMIFILIAMIVAIFGQYRKMRKEQPGKWYQLNNETTEKPNKEKPSLVFISEPLPEKAGLYDICNFDDMKPVETMQEPEKNASLE